MTIPEMAARYRVTDSCVRNWIRLRKIKATKTDCGWIIPDDEVRPETMLPQERWKAHERPMGRPPRRAKKMPAAQLTDEQKREMIWNNHLSQNPRSLEWFSKKFGVSVDRIRSIYDEELFQRLHQEGGTNADRLPTENSGR